MTSGSLGVALVTDVFFEEGAEARLRDRLREARVQGAEIAVLPELGLNPWSPATRTPVAGDAEEVGGSRHRLLSVMAADVGIAIVGGAIVRLPGGRRRSRALVFDSSGVIVATYEKLHLPEQPGFWETSHYDPGSEPPSVIHGFGLRIGLQLCSDVNRPEGSHVLGALGAELIVAPRATRADTYGRWRTVFQANAITSCTYVVSVNRPGPEQGAPIGGPSLAVGPDGSILLETTERVATVVLEREQIMTARRAYPGYLPVRADVYAEAWRRVAAGGRAGAERPAGLEHEDSGGSSRTARRAEPGEAAVTDR